MSATFGYFNTYGDCTGIATGVVPVDNPNARPVPLGTDPNAIWYDAAADEVKQREPCPVSFKEVYEVGEALTLPAYPGCAYLVDGVKTTGSVDTSEARVFFLQMLGRYQATLIISVNDYAAQRRAAYPPIAEQLDMLFHDSDAWRAAIAAVKATYPKPEEG